MIKPHGSTQLNSLYIEDATERAAQLKRAETLPSLLLNSAAAANAVMLGAGYFNPLSGYMNLEDALSVAESMHTTAGLFWPIPILNLTHAADGIKVGDEVALRDPNQANHPVMATLIVETVETVTVNQLETMAQHIFGTLDPNHPGVATFLGLGNTLLSGSVQVLSYSYFADDFPDTFQTARQIREDIQRRGWETVVAFQTRNPMHRAH